MLQNPILTPIPTFPLKEGRSKTSIKAIVPSPFRGRARVGVKWCKLHPPSQPSPLKEGGSKTSVKAIIPSPFRGRARACPRMI